MSRAAQGAPNKGSVALDALCTEYGAQKRVADELGADEAQFSRWRRGLRKPEPGMRGKIQEKHGIPWQAWDEPADEAPASERNPTPGKEGAA